MSWDARKKIIGGLFLLLAGGLLGIIGYYCVVEWWGSGLLWEGGVSRLNEAFDYLFSGEFKVARQVLRHSLEFKRLDTIVMIVGPIYFFWMIWFAIGRGDRYEKDVKVTNLVSKI